VNQHLSRATQWAESKSLRPRVREEVRPDALQGIVLEQSPAPDTLLNNSTIVEFVVSRSTITAASAQTIRYDVPAGSDRVQVRIVLRDERGEREVFEGYQDAGGLVEVPVVPRGPSRARIFVNGVLIEERALE
jgi:predicted Rdx family selenoprotein